MCSPSWFHQRHGSDLTYDFNVYKNDGQYFQRRPSLMFHTGAFYPDEYFDDIGIAYRQEIKELYELGCRKFNLSLLSPVPPCFQGHIQFDDPTFCYFCNDKMIAGMEMAGVDHAVRRKIKSDPTYQYMNQIVGPPINLHSIYQFVCSR
jgi:hypothetical protein